MEIISMIDKLVLEFFLSIYNPLLNIIIVIFTKLGDYGFIWLIIIFIMILYKVKDWRYGLYSLIASSVLNEFIFKNIFDRTRPCNSIEINDMLIECPMTYSFPSSHALVAFCFAYVFSKLVPKYKYIIWIIAFFVAISRAYLGVHYFFDVLVGALLGILIGYIIIRIKNYINDDAIKSDNKR